MIKRGHLEAAMHTERMPCRDEGMIHKFRDTNDGQQSASSPQLGERLGTESLTRPQKEPSCQHLILDFGPPELWDNRFLYKPPRLWFFCLLVFIGFLVCSLVCLFLQNPQETYTSRRLFSLTNTETGIRSEMLTSHR